MKINDLSVDVCLLAAAVVPRTCKMIKYCLEENICYKSVY